MGKQDHLRSKIGGLPWGLPLEKWPICCGYPEKLLAQLIHKSPMLDLGEEGNILHLFQCLDCGLGSRGCDGFILNDKELGEELTKADGWDHKPEYGDPLIGELWLYGWETEDDGIPEERSRVFFDKQRYRALMHQFPQIEWFDGRRMTRFGGTPRWTGNGPMDLPPKPFEFLFQLDTRVYIAGVPPKTEEGGCDIHIFAKSRNPDTFHRVDRVEESDRKLNAPWAIIYEEGADNFGVEYTNFGSDGTAFVFIDRTCKPHRIKWFWTR